MLDRLAIDGNAGSGRVMILPSSHPGSPRYMQQSYEDAMQIVQRFGKPSLFLT